MHNGEPSYNKVGFKKDFGTLQNGNAETIDPGTIDPGTNRKPNGREFKSQIIKDKNGL